MPHETALERRKCFVHESIPEKDKELIRQEVCQALPVNFGSFKPNGKVYCVLHFPNRNKEGFGEVFQARLEQESYDFRGVYFPDAVSLENRTFHTIVDFSFATFAQSTNFFSAKFTQDAKFISAEFLKDALFNSTFLYENAYFGSARFCNRAYFVNTEFTYDADFRSVIFEEESETFFLWTYFQGVVNFRFATFKGYVSFTGEDESTVFLGDYAQLNMQNARLEKPERISFQNVVLRPSWFINTDPRKFLFTNVHWKNLKNFAVDAEIKDLEEARKILNAKHLLTIACRHLATNYEENNRFEEASKFRQMAFETEWLDKKENVRKGRGKILISSQTSINNPSSPPKFFSASRKIIKEIWQEIKTSQIILSHRLYRFSSKFGESSGRALLVLVGIIIVCAILYMSPLCRFGKAEKTSSLGLTESITYSLRVMVLQRPEPLPENDGAKLVVALESVLAPLQAALLALAVRRKFMR